MSWSYRSPSIFPASYTSALRTLAATPEVPFLFGYFHSHASARAEAQNFSYFRWCIRQRPDAFPALSALELSCQIRAKHEFIAPHHLLYLISKPDRVRMLTAMNPDLRPIFSADCQ